MSHNVLEMFYLSPVAEAEVDKIGPNFKDSVAGWDEFKLSIIKTVKDSIKIPLAHIGNVLFDTGIFPIELTIAKIVAIFKFRCNCIFTNYRPVTVLPVFSKITERLMYDRLISYIPKHKILFEYQFAFKWFKGYLTGRSQQIICNGCKSSNSEIKCGVPQGSILRPLIFLLYTNGLATVSEACFSILFADDSNMFISGKDMQGMSEKLNSDMENMRQQLYRNKRSLMCQNSLYGICTKNKHLQKEYLNVWELSLRHGRSEINQCYWACITRLPILTSFIAIVCGETHIQPISIRWLYCRHKLIRIVTCSPYLAPDILNGFFQRNS